MMGDNAEINHFLVCYDVASHTATVKPFGTDYDAAIQAYDEAEGQLGDATSLDIVLLSADSLETIKRTHSSYFETQETFESLLPPGLLVG